MNSVQINDLFDYGYSIFQNDNYFKFSIDSVLLAEFVNLKKGKNKILDLCSGNAPVPMILTKRYDNKNIQITGIEIQKEIYDLAIKSLEFNNLTSINMINGDVNNLKSLVKDEKFDVVTCNPPYFKVNNSKIINEDPIKAIARHEIKINLENLVLSASKVIQNQGYFYLVNHSTRLTEVFDVLHKYNFGIKRIVFVHDNKDAEANFFLVEAMYNGKDFVKILPPVFVRDKVTYKNIFER